MLVWEFFNSFLNLVMTLGSIAGLVVLVVTWYELLEGMFFKVRS